MKKIVFVTNIPTPYRIYFYNELHKVGIDFEVIYLRNTESDRNWIVSEQDFAHPKYIDNGIYFMLGRFHVHINPSVIKRIITLDSSTEIIFGLAWNDFDMLVISLLKRLGLIRANLNFWTEANYLTIGASKDNFLKRQFRKFVYHSSTGFHIKSGEMTSITLEKWGIKVNKFIDLPNVIEEKKFSINEAEILMRNLNNLPIFFMPVRLIENVKGIINFFQGIGFSNIRKAKFLIAGDGIDANDIHRYINVNNLNDNIELLGYQDTLKIVELYKTANVFLLPSFSDPCPLTINEAMKMSLPLLISNRCGNHFEAVSRENGLTFDPFDSVSIKVAYETMISLRESYQRMGESSLEKFNSHYECRNVLMKFKNNLCSF